MALVCWGHRLWKRRAGIKEKNRYEGECIQWRSGHGNMSFIFGSCEYANILVMNILSCTVHRQNMVWVMEGRW
jgi:hypothetical protein